MKEQKQEQKTDGKQNNALFYLAIVLLTLSVLIFGYNLIKITKITGLPIATLNLTIEDITNINFTTDNINWGSGQVAAGRTRAQLNTAGGANNVTNGNWTGNTAGLVIQNIGNRNATLDLAAGKSADNLLKGTSPGYQWNVSNIEPDSCKNATIYSWNIFNNTNASMRICSVFGSLDDRDTIRIDFNITIPSDSPAATVGDTITATATGI